MPPRKTPASRTPAAKKATAAKGGDEPSRFAAGTGPLAESIRLAGRQGGKTAAAAQAQGLSLQRIDQEGAPVGEPVRQPGVAHLEFKPDDSGIELEFDRAFEQAADPGAEAVARQEGAENPQVAPVPAGNMEFETSDPATVATVRELTRIPIPTAVIAQWFPAYFRPEPGATPWNTCKVFLTPQGLYVYRTAPAEPETFTTGATPAWYAGVDFAKTKEPVTGYAAMNAGIPIFTSAGQVNVQPYGGCGCSARKLKNWTPAWTRNRISWADAVKLADTTAGR